MSFGDTIQYIKMRMEGFDFEPIIEDIVQEKEELIANRMNQLRVRLLEKQSQVNAVEKELLNDVVVIPIFEAAQNQKENIEESMNALKPVISDMEGALAISENRLASLQRETALLTNDLQKLTNELRNGKGKYYAFSGPLDAFSQKVADKKIADQKAGK